MSPTLTTLGTALSLTLGKQYITIQYVYCNDTAQGCTVNVGTQCVIAHLDQTRMHTATQVFVVCKEEAQAH